MTQHRVIFVPDDYWTNPPKENSMTENYADKPIARDVRMATALVIHHRAGDRDGMIGIVADASETGRASALLVSLLDLMRVFIVQSRTAAGVDYLGTYVQGIGSVKPTDASSMDIHRACRILDGHGRGDLDSINEVLIAARAEKRCTQVLLALLDVYAAAVPELSSSAGRTWLDACIAASHAEEATE